MSRRLQKELAALEAKPLDFASAKPIGENLLHWNALIEGPEDTPYKGGTFSVELLYPGEYPFKPPKIQFKTKIFHPQIKEEDGSICLDMFSEW